jgi:3-phosphoshikimate 1-carboxyvinyltransferase
MIEIKTAAIRNTQVRVPGSKSYTHRTLIAAALAQGQSQVLEPLQSQDTLLTLAALNQMGINSWEANGNFWIQGTGGRLNAPPQPIELANSGTSMRLLTGIVAIGRGRFVLQGSPRMHQRPIAELLVALRQLGVDACSLGDNGCPPVAVTGQDLSGGPVSIDCGVSSQYLSSLLLMGPLTRQGLDIEVVNGPVSKPYVDMTVDILEQFGVHLQREGHTRFRVPGGQCYRSGTYRVEPDGSQAGYFWSAAALTGARIKVMGLSPSSRQGDVRLAEVLARMGCQVSQEADGIAVTGAPLQGVVVDMGDMPDQVPTLAVVAAFARGTTVIRNVAHLRDKESDRLGAVCTELTKMGIQAHSSATGLTIEGGRPKGAVIDTYDDHRIAMSFAPAGLVVPGVWIADEGCVAKSFPTFWEVFESLYA